MKRTILNAVSIIVFIAVMYGFRRYLYWVSEPFLFGLVTGMIGMALFFYFIEWLQPGILSAHSHRKEAERRFREAGIASEAEDSPPLLPR